MRREERAEAIGTREGATLACGGHGLANGGYSRGFFHEPTVFGDVHPGMRIAQEEVFGPLLAIIPFDDEAEAVKIANDVRFGLADGVWTSDVGRMIRMAEKLKAGVVWVNTPWHVMWMVWMS